jgi:hypothetical protein
MALKRTPPRDPVQLGKLMVDIATGQVPDMVDDGRDPAAVARGRAGGLKGGAARAKAVDPQRRSDIAKSAAERRWSKGL